MKCWHCKHENSEDAKFCIRCGEYLKEIPHWAISHPYTCFLCGKKHQSSESVSIKQTLNTKTYVSSSLMSGSWRTTIKEYINVMICKKCFRKRFTIELISFGVMYLSLYFIICLCFDIDFDDIWTFITTSDIPILIDIWLFFGLSYFVWELSKVLNLLLLSLSGFKIFRIFKILENCGLEEAKINDAIYTPHTQK